MQYRYNSLGKVSERIDQLGDTETFRYDEEGNLSLHIDRDGRQLQRACNVFGQPVYEKASDAEGKHTNISTWHYDSLGRVTRAVCDGKSYEYIYDAYGNLKEKRSNGKRLVSYTHDRAGQITEIRDPEGVCTRYEYDILGRRSRIFNDDGLEVCYGYDALNRIRHIRYGNEVETAYTYDGDGNIRTLETKAGENVLLSFAYRYDGNGNRTAKAGTQAALGGITSEITAGNNALDLSYAYDVRGQLLEERRNGASVCYAYDKAGNRIRKTDVQGEIRYLYNAKNQLIAEESPADRKQFSYDRQGGIIEEKNAAGIRLFSYNSRHQQTRVETETGSVQENRYDAEGLRFELLENGRRTSFVYHDGELLQEEGREEQKTSYHLGAGMEAFRRGQELSYYHRDEQLSTVFVTDGHRNVQNSYQYDAFGMSLGTTEKLNNRIRYTGQQYDELTEQYYLRARYYNPVAGRFMQEDVYQGDGLNLYAYCHNNPVVYYDPSGYDSGWNTWPPQVRENINRGNNFNRENRPNYTYNEIRVAGDGKKPYFVVDSYEPPFIDENGNFVEGQIVSRKSTQLGEVQLSTALEYVTEADKKYAPGTEILDIDFNPQELRGKTLQGDLYLEVPKQKIGIPEKVSDKADSLNITIRENTEEHPKTSRNNENNLLDGLPENEENSSKSCR